MDVAITILLFAAGLVLIIKGGDWFVDAASWIAKVSGIPEFVIGATIVSVATTVPELMVSVIGTAKGEIDLAVGNAVGSVTANTGLIMGISIVCIPIAIKRGQIALKAVLMVAATVVLMIFGFINNMGIAAGIILLIIFAIFVYENIVDAKKSSEETKAIEYNKKAITKKIFLFLVGIAAIVIGSNLLINYGSEIAHLLGVPSSIIGVTMVAIGTSLPELVTTVTAIVKKEAEMSIGNIIGANIIDITLILPICALISGNALTISKQSYMLDIPVCLCATLIAVIPPFVKQKFYRLQGTLILAFYAVYVAVLVMYFT